MPQPSRSTAVEMARRGGTVVFEGIVGGDTRLPLSSDTFCLKDLRLHGVFAYASHHFVKTLRLIESGLLNVHPLITHTFPLADYERAFEMLRHRPEPVVKVLLKP